MTPTTRRALIFSISGQDGALLARLLLAKGYEVCGASHDAETQSFANLETLGIRDCGWAPEYVESIWR